MGPAPRPESAPRCQDDSILAPPGEHAVVSQLQSMAYERMIPLNVSLELTLKCNIRCLHCYNFDRDTDGPACGSGQVDSPAPELALEEILRVMGELRAAGTLFLSLTGGEVLSSPHLFPVLDRARELNLAVQMLATERCSVPAWRPASPAIATYSASASASTARPPRCTTASPRFAGPGGERWTVPSGCARRESPCGSS